MARTRTSDPGRVPALHYAATDGQRHAKPPIIRLHLAMIVGLCAWGAELDALVEAGPAGAQPDARPPAHAGAPRAAPGPWRGRAACSAADPGAGRAHAGTPATRRGARAALHVTTRVAASAIRRGRAGGRPVHRRRGGWRSGLAAGADDPRSAGLASERVLDGARGAARTRALIVAAPAAQMAALRERGLAPYVDEFMPPSWPIATSDELAAPTTGWAVPCCARCLRRRPSGRHRRRRGRAAGVASGGAGSRCATAS